MDRFKLANLYRADAPENLLGRLALVLYESVVKQVPSEAVAEQRFPGSQAIAALVKAAQSPAATGVAGYAAELSRLTYGEVQGLLYGTSVLASSVPPAQLLTFGNSGSIFLPVRIGSPTDVAAGFRAEAQPITVKGMMFGGQTLTAKSLAVLLTSTAEMLNRSAIDLSAYFQNEIRKDTSLALDQHFLGNTAASAIAPAGVRNGLPAGDTRAATGATVAAIVSDLRVMLLALADAGFGSPATRWVMHPRNWFVLSLLLNAAGGKVFPETAEGNLAGIPALPSLAMPPDIVLLVDFEQYAFAMGTPQFEPTLMATIHEESATPLPIASPGSPATVAAPTRSLFQTNSMALRLVMDASWVKLRPAGHTQELHSVAW